MDLHISYLRGEIEEEKPLLTGFPFHSFFLNILILLLYTTLSIQ